VYTNTLTPTQHHIEFQKSYSGDTEFRKGYWKHVRERFYFIEELMIRDTLHDVISMEYDVLVYGSFQDLLTKLQSSHQTLRMVRDNDDRGHPAFMYIPTAEYIGQFNVFLTSLASLPYEDMQALGLFAKLFPIHYFPVISEHRRSLIPNRKSACGHMSTDSYYLSEDSEHFGLLFDSLVVGQWIGGVDSRNTRGAKITRYENESALYNIREMTFGWAKDGELWRPILDNRPLMTIHVHSKALSCFLSDRSSVPMDDYDVTALYKSLLPN
jgi:hypothetical protein